MHHKIILAALLLTTIASPVLSQDKPAAPISTAPVAVSAPVLTTDEINVDIRLIDAGIKAVGVQLYQDDKTASALQSLIGKLAKMQHDQTEVQPK